MDKRQFTCIVCPVGCKLDVTIDGDNVSVTGNECKRGEKYAIAEVTNPTRMVTSSVRVFEGNLPLVSIKTSSAIPKGKIDEALAAIKDAKVTAPVKIGDVVIPDVADTGIDIIATRNVERA